MKKIKLEKDAVKAIKIGSLCSVSYLAVYIVRNILGAVSPRMIESGSFSTEEIGTLSSVYFVVYAIGQLVNGAIGDKIKSKYMISLGLLLAGISNCLLANTASSKLAAIFSYGAAGFFLSMIYGPMTKVVAENVDPIYAPRCSLGYTFASFFGSPMAGMLAAFLAWQGVFGVSSAMLIVMGTVTFLIFLAFEKKGVIAYNQYQPPKGNGGGIKLLIKRQIIKYTLIAILTGVVRTTVVFWLPTYISQYLGFSAERSALLFTVATFFISTATFVAVFLYERLGRNIDLTNMVSFAASALFFLLAFLVKIPYLNVAFMVLAILGGDSASAMLWARYCPSLRDTGMVSGATGFLDFMSYMAASLSSTIFAGAVSMIGWGWLILIWFGLMVLGVIVAIPYGRKRAEI